MESTLALANKKSKIKFAVIDLLGIALIYFIPALSHLFNFPLYLAEPMRILIIISLVHTNKTNAYILAATLPVFSFAISSHPSIIKTAIISTELLLNVWIFFELMKLIKNKFAAAFTSIVVSKIYYYSIKFALVSLGLMQTDLFSTPLYIQLITTLVFSGYIFFVGKENLQG